MGKFKTAFKGYDKREVEVYLHKTNEYHESRERELEECIKRLKEENDYLYAKNSEYHRNEERVSGAIVKAMEVKSDLESSLRKKIALEEDRLKIFKTKWLAYVKGINRANADRVVEDAQEYIESFRREFSARAERELDLKEEKINPAEKSYLSEIARLSELTGNEAPSYEKMSAASLSETRSTGSGEKYEKIGFIEE